jgi:NAD(P)H dehydrogenase (quinone)
MKVMKQASINVLVVYDSSSGNTEKMAEEVAEGAKEVPGAVVAVKRPENVTKDDMLKSDCIIVGSPTYYGLMSTKIKKLFDESVIIHGKLTGKVGAAFTSSGGTSTGGETTLMSILTAMLVHGMVVQGRADDLHYGAWAEGTPDKDALKSCRELGKKTAELAMKLSAK